MFKTRGLLLTGFLFIAACGTDSIAPGEVALSHAIAHGLETKLFIDPVDVGPGGAFTAEYSITNSRAEPVHLKSSCIAIARGVVYRDGDEARFIGSGSGCYTAVGNYKIAAGETFRWTWQVEAAIVLRAYPDGTQDIEDAKPGEYVFRVKPDVFEINEVRAQLPVLEQGIQVR
jgi:hypothetical protein